MCNFYKQNARSIIMQNMSRFRLVCRLFSIGRSNKRITIYFGNKFIQATVKSGTSMLFDHTNSTGHFGRITFPHKGRAYSEYILTLCLPDRKSDSKNKVWVCTRRFYIQKSYEMVSTEVVVYCISMFEKYS